jgi:SAM-dependent MidA family methyltransferase
MATDDTPAGRLLRSEIERAGPISFERFMDVALYDPAVGYYRRSRDPFGIRGDFYTAAQLQPVFGAVVRAVLEALPSPRAIVDLGAGRAEMAAAFPDWDYRAIEAGDPWPDRFAGFFLLNELIDALPVSLHDANGREVLVGWERGQFVFLGEPVEERRPRAEAIIRRIAATLTEGFVLILDYGYEAAERPLRFPAGTLMSYRGHQASGHAGIDVLRDAGHRDLTAHVDFTALRAAAIAAGLHIVWQQKLSRMVLSAGEGALAALAAAGHTPQLKTLLFGMGESFDALLLRRAAGELHREA